VIWTHPLCFSSLAINHSPTPTFLPKRLTYSSWHLLHPLPAPTHLRSGMAFLPGKPFPTSGLSQACPPCSLSTPLPTTILTCPSPASHHLLFLPVSTTRMQLCIICLTFLPWRDVSQGICSFSWGKHTSVASKSIPEMPMA
jgi:hypothetical protein